MEEYLFDNPVCPDIIYSEEYASYIVDYYEDIDALIQQYSPACYQIANGRQAVIYMPMESEGLRINRYGYREFPKVYGLMDDNVMEATGVARLRRQPGLELDGQGIIIGFVDTGIDYRHPAFLNADGTSRVLSIWDQTISTGEHPQSYGYGSEYTQEQINEALRSENPLELVPTVDENSHGTFLAGLAAGNIIETSAFSGMAPRADIMVVKVKGAKNIYRDFYRIPGGVECYQEDDILLGISYILERATILRKPVVICLGIGTNLGDHDGNSQLGEVLSRICQLQYCNVCVSAGNEANERHHFLGAPVATGDYEEVEINVGQNSLGFVAELWTSAPTLLSVGFVSPGGEVINKIPARLMEREKVTFVLEQTQIILTYELVEGSSGDELVFMRFLTPVPGIWRIRVYNDRYAVGDYHIWLPIRGFVDADTYFLRPNPGTTLCEPSNAKNVTTVGGYQISNNSIYSESSRGDTRTGITKPDFVAPAVAVRGPVPGGGYEGKTGTSISSAITSGASALIMQWLSGTPTDGIRIKKYMIIGATRRSGIDYPTPIWGFGTLNVFGTFETLRT